MKKRPPEYFYIPTGIALFGIILIFGGHEWLLRQYVEIGEDLDSDQHIFFPLLFLSASYLITQLFWLFGSKRRWVYDWVFLSFLLSLTLVLHLDLKRLEQNEIRIETRQLAEQRTRLRQKIARENQRRLKEIQDKLLRSQTDRYVQYEGRIPDEELNTIKALDQKMTEQLKKAVSDYEAVMRATQLKGIDDWVNVRTLDELTQQRKWAQQFLEVSRSLLDRLNRFERDYDKEVELLTLSEGGRRVAIAERERILQYFERIRLNEIRQLEPALLSSMLSILDLLIENWGRWNYDYREDDLHFENANLKEEFYYRIADMNKIVKQIKEFENEKRLE